MVMDGPRSYTGEDTVEIDCHGGVLAMRKILDTVIKYGASPAEPGEFTKRAFLNGRIDLSQAEAVIDVINAKNEYALEKLCEPAERKHPEGHPGNPGGDHLSDRLY